MRESKINSFIIKLILIILLIIGFFYRIYGLNDNHSFWTDEEHVAIFARAILEKGQPILANGYSTGIYQWLQYWLSAVSARVFGLNEFAIRFPSVIFGVLTIWVVYLLGKELFNKSVGLVAAVLTSFLKIEILWSRQARPYQTLQFFYLLSAWFVYKLIKKKDFDWRYFVGFLICGISASMMHGLGLVIFFVGFLYLLLFRFSWLKKWIPPAILLALVFGYVFKVQIFSVVSQIGKINNLFYYRVFLWHNYSLLVFLALVGFLSQILQRKNAWQIPVLFLVFQGIVASFLLGLFVRYFYIVFPFLILFAAVGLIKISQIFPKKRQLLVLGMIVFFIIAMGNKFTLIPRQTYSLNEDMQEIPEVDWKEVYSFVGEKLIQDKDIILVTNWNDLPIWFLGEGSPDYLARSSPREVDYVSGAMIVPSLDEFRKMLEREEKGLIIIDSWDDYIPDGVRDYCRENLKKELEVDRLYPIQPRYWPVEVYSWGI